MKTKLGHLIIASLISLSVVLSTISMSYAGGTKKSKSTTATTSASGFDEGKIRLMESTSATTSASGFDKGKITQKNGNGFIHLEKYDPQKYLPQPILDLETTVEAIDYNTAIVTVKNISQAKVEGTFQITYMVVDLDGEVPNKCWVDHLPVPWPGHSTNYNTNNITIPPEFVYYFKSWRLHAWANVPVAAPNHINESDYTNNYDEDYSLN